MCEIMDRWVNEVKAEGERIGYQNGEKAGYVNGEKAGYANGEKVSAMRTCMDFGKSKNETIAYLSKSLHLSIDDATKSVDAFWEKSDCKGRKNDNV